MEYTRQMADRMTLRHLKRTVSSRQTFLRAILCTAVRDYDPSYEGDDPDTGPFRGPHMARWTVETLGYFARAAGFTQPTLIGWLRNGMEKAAEHSARRAVT